MRNQSVSSIAHSTIRVGIAISAAIVVTPIALSFAVLKEIMRCYLKSKMVVAQYVARVKKRTAND